MPADALAGFVNLQIIQNGPKPTVRNPVLLSQHLDITVNEFCSFGTLSMRFRNPYDQPVEMMYSFPLLDGGAVITGIKTEWDGQVIEGVVRGSKEGKKEYDDALSKGHTASMVEHAENDLFLWRIGGIPAGAVVCVTSRFVGPIVLTKKAGKKALTQFTLTLPTTVPPWYKSDDALAHSVATVSGVKVLTQGELSALTVDKLRRRLQTMAKAEGNVETGEKLRKDDLISRLYQLQQDGLAATSAAVEAEAAIAQEVSLANPPFSAVVRSKFVTAEFQSVVATSPTHGSPSSHFSSGPELTVQFDNLFATPTNAVHDGASNLQIRWCIEGILPNISCYGRVVAGSGRVAPASAAAADVIARDQAATHSLNEAVRALEGGPLAAEAAALAKKAAHSERALEEVAGLLYCEPTDSLANGQVHITVLVDFSGSMTGIRIQNALKALRAILTSLDNRSTFSVFKFGSSCVGVTIDNQLIVEASPSNIQNMMRKVLPNADMGGTELLGAVRAVLDVGAQTQRRNNVLIITDGEVGASEAASVKSLLSAACPGKHLVGIIGVGNDVTRSTLQAVVDGGCGPQGLVFDTDSEDTIAGTIIGAVDALFASEFREVRWPSQPLVCTGRRIAVNQHVVSASWALYSEESAGASHSVSVAPLDIDPPSVRAPRVIKVWTDDALRALTVDKLRKMLRSQIKTELPGGFGRKEDMVSRLIQMQSETAAANAAAVQAEAAAYAEALVAHANKSRPICVPSFAVSHAETVRNMCIVAAVSRTRDISCSLAEAKQLALRYGFVGPDCDCVMVAISQRPTGEACKSTVAVGLPGTAQHAAADDRNMDIAVWGYGSGPSLVPQPLTSATSRYTPGLGLGGSRKLATPAKPASKCIKMKAKSATSANSKFFASAGVAKQYSVSKHAPKMKSCAKKSAAPKKCAAKKAGSYSSSFAPRCASPPSQRISSAAAAHIAPAKRSRDSVSLLDILGALTGGSWQATDPTVKLFIDAHCKKSSALSSDAAATIAIIAILRSKFSALKKGWHMHVKRAKAHARKSIGEAKYASMKRDFKAALI